MTQFGVILSQHSANRIGQWRHIPIIIAMMVVSGSYSDLRSQTAEDILVVKRKDSDETYERRGFIQAWNRNSIVLSVDNKDREIDLEDVVEVKPQWVQEYREAQVLIESGDLPNAASKLQEAFSRDPRSWAKRQIQADLVSVLQAMGDPSGAASQFIKLIESSPQSRFYYVCPLPWIEGTWSLGKLAEPLMQSRQPMEKLLGASWLLSGPQRDAATKALEELSRDIDPNIKALAIAQLWRPRIFSANEKQIELWLKLARKMSPEIQAGPLFILAQAQARLGQNGAATIDLMRIPILHPEQLQLASAALYRAGQLLQNAGQQEQARTVWEELYRKFPTTIWGQQVASQFQTSDTQ